MRLTTFEKFVYYDDRPEYPWHVCVRLQFKGSIDPTAAESAFAVTLKRHALLTSHIKVINRSLQWVPAEDQLISQASKLLQSDLAFPELEYLNLEYQIGFRVVQSSSDGNLTLTFQMHHCCVDGKGALEVIGDWLLAYHQACADSESDITLPELDPSMLSQRNHLGFSLWQRIKMIPGQSYGLLGAGEFLLRTPVPLLHLASHSEIKSKIQYPAVLVHTFDSQEFNAIKEFARTKSCTINDYLICHVHLAIHQWRKARGEGNLKEWIRMMIPINLRSSFDDKIPASNVVGSIFIDRRGTDMLNIDQFLLEISQQMQLIKKHQIGFAFLWSLWLQNLIPGSLKKAANNNQCLNSTTLTNFGKVFDSHPLTNQQGVLGAGELRLSSVDVMAPIRPLNQATFAVCSYADKLSITLHYDATIIEPENAQSLLDQLAINLPQSIHLK
ncbi:MAG: hypothetical protein ACKVH8_16915 [Pirellulales bacterium]